jgi:putative zinc finger/helix-turn-helix YgiT family protein
MRTTKSHKCVNCGEPVTPDRRSYRYTESGVSNVVLQNVEIADCTKCGHSDVIIPRVAGIHRLIAGALLRSPARLTGEQLRFLRKHLGMTGGQFAKYLHTDRTKISKWERGEDRIGPSTDRLVRLLVAALDKELRPAVADVANWLGSISDESDTLRELHIDAPTLTASWYAVRHAA